MAQAQHAQLTLVTRDPKFRLYGVAIVPSRAFKT